MESTTTPALRCSPWDRPYKIQNLNQWQAQVSGIQNEMGLRKARFTLNKGNQGMAYDHPFESGTPECFDAYRMLADRARQLGLEWNGMLRKYVLIEK